MLMTAAPLSTWFMRDRKRERGREREFALALSTPALTFKQLEKSLGIGKSRGKKNPKKTEKPVKSIAVQFTWEFSLLNCRHVKPVILSKPEEALLSGGLMRDGDSGVMDRLNRNGRDFPLNTYCKISRGLQLGCF